jgi:hypothetical protein
VTKIKGLGWHFNFVRGVALSGPESGFLRSCSLAVSRCRYCRCYFVDTLDLAQKKSSFFCLVLPPRGRGT